MRFFISFCSAISQNLTLSLNSGSGKIQIKNMDKITEIEKRILASYGWKKFHEKHNEHTFILKEVKSYLEKRGYKVYSLDKSKDRDKAIKYIRKLENGNLTAIFQPKIKGTRPDLLGIKGKNNILVDVLAKDNVVTKIRQYLMSRVNKVIISIPPIPRPQDLEIWICEDGNKIHKLRYKSRPQIR